MKKLFFISLFGVLVLTGCSQDKMVVLSLEEAKAKAASFINDNLMQEGQSVSIKEAAEESGLYKVVVNMPNGQEIETYLSKDGEKFFPQVMGVAETEKAVEERKKNQEAAQTQAAADVPKAQKAEVELFVMSFCPYGVIAENAMAPVFDLLGDKADINIRYIASIEGDDINEVKSLHGPIEGIEDARQLCVEKNYGKEAFWQYVGEINEKCYPIYSQGDDVYEECWTTAAQNAGINRRTIDNCVQKEGPGLIREEDAAAKEYGVTGSPTLIINGSKINAARNPEGFKTAICNGFEEAPEECGEALSEEGGSNEGGC